ncbi:MAG TPA: DUF4055 domain-containing protein [Flavobacteriales bacterium]|nr:DUF4055 domain-containing protein [Flavobacteriales bacterium]
MSNDVTTPREEYTTMLPSVEKNRAAVGGQRVVRAGGIKYLTPLASMMCETTYANGIAETKSQSSMTTEGRNKYNKYLSNAYFLGATGMTVTGLSGLISAKKPVKNIPASVAYLDKNINGKGQSLRDFSDDAVNEAFTAVWSGILVARPTTPEGASKLDEEQQNLRPKLLHYKFESIINWDYEVINNIEKLSLLVLKESTTKRDGFEVKSVFQYRVLELINGFYAQSLYDEDGELLEAPASVIFNGKPSDEIPFYWIVAATRTKAVIDDLVDCNFEHYNIYADYGSKLHYSSFIIYTENGVTNGASNNMVIGNGVKWNGGEGAEFGVLQPDGNADSHRIALQDTETRMSALLASILKPNTSGAESAEAKSLDKVTQNTVSASVAITVSEAITKGLNFASRTMGGTEDAEFMLNTDYDPTLLNAQLLTSMLAARMSGDMSKQTLYENMQKGDIANPDRTFEDEQALITNEGTGMGDE